MLNVNLNVYFTLYLTIDEVSRYDVVRLTADHPPEDQDFRRAFAKALKLVFRDRKIKKARAAAQLAVSRQAFYDYLKGKYLPQRPTMAEAFWLWDLHVEYRGRTFSKEHFPRPAEQTGRKPEQLTIADALKALKPEQITTRIGPQRQGCLILVLKLRFGEATSS
jgi:hypothetical protein